MKPQHLILLHGYPFNRKMWYGVIAGLGPGVVITAPDLRGFGKAELGSDKPSVDVLADDVARMMDEKGIASAMVGGMSMGGYVALAFAEKYPERLQGLALISTQAQADTPEAKAGRRELISEIRQKGAAHAAEAIMPRLFAPRNLSNPDFQVQVRTGAEEAGVEGLCWALEALAKRPDRTHVVKTLRVPAVIVHGREDKLIPHEKARALAEQLPDPFYQLIKEAGHATPLEAPGAISTELLKLIARVRAVPPPAPASAPVS